MASKADILFYSEVILTQIFPEASRFYLNDLGEIC